MSTEYQGYEKEAVDIFGIKFAPLFIPLKRRWETFCTFVILVGGLAIFMFILFIYVFLLFYVSYGWVILLLCVAWTIYDKDTPETGGRGPTIFRNRMTGVRDYFPSRLVKTVDLPVGKNYLIAVYPHGVICLGLVSNYVMDANFVEAFPDLECKPIILGLPMKTPIAREFLLSTGLSSASARNIFGLLESKEKNKAVVLMVGGAAESSLAQPGTNKIIINNRKGFVKLALKTGASLVPAYTFGENELYDQVRGPLVTKIQQLTKKYTGINLIFMKGRGLFQYSFGLMPRRRPLTHVVGKPIDVPKIENPTPEQVDEYHEKYKTGLVSLFENNKEKYDVLGKDAELICT